MTPRSAPPRSRKRPSGSRQRRAGGGAAEVPCEREAAAMPAFRQVGEKQLPQEVVVMAWSPKRDLIALANRAGEVLLHRLANFQRVWSLPPNENTGKEVTALAWRPDGKSNVKYML